MFGLTESAELRLSTKSWLVGYQHCFGAKLGY